MLYRNKNINSSIKLGFLNKVKGFISKPTKTFMAIEDDTLWNAIKYAAICFVILSVFTRLINTVIFGSTIYIFGWKTDVSFLFIPVLAILSGIFATLVILIGGVWQHLCVFICGGRKSYTQTVKAIAYGGTPYYLLGWIPYIGFFIGSIAALIVTIIGLRELHQISTIRAIEAWLLAISLPVVLVILIILIILLVIFLYL